MTGGLVAFVGAAVFDGRGLHADSALLVAGARVSGIVPRNEIPAGAERRELEGGILSPGYVDLQVNGGGGVQFNDDPSVPALRCIAEAHGRLGSTTILPTLITDTPDRTKAAIAAAAQAIADGVPGIAGLHLEGPHISQARKGAHDPALVRRMTPDDLALMVAAARKLPVLMVTLAPESASGDQIEALAGAGAIVSLGHTDSSYDTCMAAVSRGATAVTHLFNAMSQFGSREPGLVGAALDSGSLCAGLIADAIHVHPAVMAATVRAKSGPGRIFLVSDAMASAGSAIDGFTLNGRRIDRRNGRLTLADGTLAGADLDLTTAVGVMVDQAGVSRPEALAMATSIPAAVAGLQGDAGTISEGRQADFIWLDDRHKLGAVWLRGSGISI